MFDELVESSVVRKKTNTGWAVILSTAVQVLVLLVLVLIPLIYTQALPKAMMATLLIAPPPPPPPPPPPAEAPKVIKPVARLIQQGKLMQPRAIPKEVAVLREAELPPEAPVTGNGVLGGVDQGLLGGLGAGPAIAPPPPPKQQQRI
jgi:protein TonB